MFSNSLRAHDIDQFQVTRKMIAKPISAILMFYSFIKFVTMPNKVNATFRDLYKKEGAIGWCFILYAIMDYIHLSTRIQREVRIHQWWFANACTLAAATETIGIVLRFWSLWLSVNFSLLISLSKRIINWSLVVSINI